MPPTAAFTPEDLVVVIPTRDRWSILERTLASLATQSVSGHEVVVVVDGTDQSPPPLQADRVLVKEWAGASAARNHGANSSDRSLLLFLGDDIVPDRDLVRRHLERHNRETAATVAVLGHTDWHPEVRANRIQHWLDWSGTQFDYRLLRAQGIDDAGFGRFYSSNVSLKRELFDAVRGFDEDFIIYYEDIDVGWRLAQHGMVLRYEPDAVGYHLHSYDWHSLVRRFEGIARSERLMASKHDWFTPWFSGRINEALTHRPVSRGWALLVDAVPSRPRRLREVAERRASRWYHQNLAPAFRTSWERSGAA